MFDMDTKKKEIKEGLLEKLIDTMLSTPDKGSANEEERETSEIAEALGEEKPKAEMKVMELELKPKAKYKLSDGTEHEDESLEDILKRQKLKA